MPLPSTLEAVLVALFPPRCVGCERHLAARPRHGLCHACLEILEPNLGRRCARCDLPTNESLCADCAARTPAFDHTRAAYIYGGPLVEIILASKFRGREDLALSAGQLLAADELANELARDADGIVPVPLGRARRRERGYNQAAIMARELSRVWRIPIVYCLERVRNTKPQSDLPLARRRENVASAFTATPVSGRLLLVDDVVTSAETANAAASALKTAGATGVTVIALARAVLE